MDVLHMCPARIVTGGTENIHQLISEMRRQGVDAWILYMGDRLDDPQPKDYQVYGCPYVTSIPEDFNGVLIFPEIHADKTILKEYARFKKAVNWQGVDVYYWHNKTKPEPFLQCKDTIHFTTMDYGMDHLQRVLGLNAIKVNDCVNDAFLEDVETDYRRDNVVLYNPTKVKLTQFQQIVMQRLQTESGVRFQPLAGYTREQMIDILHRKKLYIDFGVFSGRERIPREAVCCGCCILTSKLGAAGYYGDVPIPDQYKIDDIDRAVYMVKHVLNNYESLKPDFDIFRRALKADKEVYPLQVKELCNAFFGDNSST